MKGTPEELKSTIYKLATEGYLYELRMLVRLVKTNEYTELLSVFSDYETFIHSKNKQLFTQEVIEQFLLKNNTINTSVSSEPARQLFTCANMAACCEVFEGWTIPVNELEMHKTNEYLQLALNSVGPDKDDIGNKMAQRLNACDTARVIQPLKLLGLLKVESQACYQLSLCCSVGERDRNALHHTPFIKAAQAPVFPTSTPSPLVFGTNLHGYKNIVMIDNDTVLDAIYKQLNDENENILAMNTDLYAGLEALANKIENKEAGPRNLVVSFRLAPEAFPDIKRYLDCLAAVISEEADLVMTIGAGDNLAEFKHRLQVMNAIFDDLLTRGMQPFRIRNYKGKTPKQQHLRLVNGLSQYASYETIYCRLSKSKLGISAI